MLLEREFAGIRIETLDIEDKEEESVDIDETIMNLNEENQRLKRELFTLKQASIPKLEVIKTNEFASLNYSDSSCQKINTHRTPKVIKVDDQSGIKINAQLPTDP